MQSKVAHSCASLICAVIIFTSAVIITSATLSGLYVDNGLDQTVIQRVMTHREKLMVEREILDLLGLPSRPKHSRNVPLNRSAPIFLLDVYKTLADERDQSSRPTRSSHLSLSGDEQHAIDESDIIMTFQSKNHRGLNVRHERGRRLWFDVSDVPVEGTIMGAELRLYQSSDYKSKQPNDIYTVTVHKIVEIDSMGDLDLELVSATNTSASNEGWIELNVTSAFIEWVALPSTNQGLLINIHRVSKPEKEYKLEDIGLVNTKGEDEKQPFMVAFFKAVSSLPGVKTSSRRKRESRRRNKSEYGFSENYLRNPFNEPPSYRSSRSCQIQTLYVSFKDLEWQDWIIAPDGYGAFYCSGECNFPLNAHMNATNHAIVQTLVHLLNPTQVPKACCAPTKLTAISVLFFQDDSNVTLKKYKNMVVKSCGCH